MEKRRIPLPLRLTEPADPLLSRLTREIAGSEYLSRVINWLAAERRQAVDFWSNILQNKRTDPIRPSARTFPDSHLVRNSTSFQGTATNQPLPLDLLVAHDSTLKSNHGEVAPSQVQELVRISLPRLQSSPTDGEHANHKASVDCEGVSIYPFAGQHLTSFKLRGCSWAPCLLP
jgi:hypothetical protein